MGFRRGHRTAVVMVFVVTVLTSACGGGEEPRDGQAATGTTAGGTTSTTEEPGAGSRVTVIETEFTIRLPSATLTPGAYTFVAENIGGDPHDLVIKGPGVDEARTQVLQGGETGEVTVTLQAGSYEVWCSVGDHRARGMETTLAVA